MKYRADIDGLRAVAILLVVAFHVGLPGFGGGFIGVDVFFVISGFLITSLLWTELQRSGRISWADFYARRARRLFPALAFTALGTLVIGLFVLVPDPELRWLAQSVIAVSFFLSNVYFYVKTNGYFGAEAETLPLLNTWSLAVEEQFYLVWPALLWLAWWVSRRFATRGRTVVGLAIAGVAAVSFLVSVYLVGTNRAAAFFLLPARLWELAAGGLLALAAARLPRFGTRPALAVSLAGLIAIVGSTAFLSPSSSFPGVLAVPVVAGTVAVVWAGLAAPTNPIARVLGTAPLVAVGKVSYSWYLIHWPLLTFARVSTLKHDLGRDTAIAVGSLGLAALAYKLVERPFREQRVRFMAGTARSLAVGFGMLLVPAAVGAVVLRDTDRASQLALSPSLAAALAENRTVRSTCPNLPTGDPEAVDCTFDTAPGDAPKLLLIGDSHALALLPAAQEAARALDLDLEVLWDTGCPYVLAYEPPAGSRPVSDDCDRENRVRADYIEAEAAQVAHLLVTGRASSYVWSEEPTREAANAAAWASAVENGVRVAADRGVRVLVMHDVPHFETDVPQCVLRQAGTCSQPLEDVRDFHAPLPELLDSRLAGLADARSLDPLPVLCEVAECPGSSGDVVLYRDRTHLSEAGALVVARPILHALQP